MNKSRILKKAGQKLRSRKGATILMALLVFLVCVCIGSVVLSAGTAAAGRFSKTAESDRRYYAVESAARLLKNVFDGKTITISRTKTNTEVTKYQLITIDEETKEIGRDGGTSAAAPIPEYTVAVDIAGEESDDDSYQMAHFVSLQLFDGDLTQSPAGSEQYEMSTVSNLNKTGTVTIGDNTYSDFPEYNADYSLILNAGNPAELIFNVKAENYGVKVKFHADIHEETVTHSTPETSVVEGTDETVTQVTTTAKTMTIIWAYDGIEVQ